MSIGARIRSSRKSKGLSARRLSIQAGLDPSHVSLIEAGKRPSVAAETAAALAKALGVSLEWLITGKVAKSHPAHGDAA